MKMRYWIGIALIVIVADQITKQLADHLLQYGEPVAVFHGFNLTLLYNTGAAFSMFSDAGGWQRWFFTAIAFVVSVVIVFWLRALGEQAKWMPLALMLILGGAIGNVCDRILLGHVIDFIQVYYQAWYWPAFNIADSAICVGAVMLILGNWIIRPESETTRQ